MKRVVFLLLACGGALACSSARPSAGGAAPLFSDLGNHHVEVTTKVPMAQRYFDQGLILSYGFNHQEAVRSFLEGARQDPECAMCWWGASLALGPNINAPMMPEDAPRAWEYLEKALAAAPKASERERAYIEALATRYARNPPEDRKPLDAAYADAMRQVARRYPEDLDAQALFAEALMDVRPWDYWTKDGAPQPGTEEILSTLEGVLAKKPDHPGATHFYIHATEASKDPGRAVPAADRLRDLVPGAGHLVHMPGHTYIRVGRYADASLANEKAIAADRSYIAQCRAQGVYPLAYVPHNFHFLWVTATLEGRSGRAIEAAREMSSHTDHGMMREPGLGTLQHYWVTPLYAYVRFGKWDEILKEPKPAKDLSYPLGVWHFARGMALAGRGDLSAAEKELSALTLLSNDPEMAKLTFWEINSAAGVLGVAREVLAGEIAAHRKDWDTAVQYLRAGVQLEDQLRYNEPPDWHAPVRQTLGAVLLEAGRPAEAEAAYREDLERVPENGFSLFGLRQALEAAGKTQEAAEVQKRFEKAWSRADVTLTASRF